MHQFPTFKIHISDNDLVNILRLEHLLGGQWHSEQTDFLTSNVRT